MIISLFTADGSFVVNVLTMPWQKWPEGIQWGSRTFFWNEFEHQYREGLLWWCPPDTEPPDQSGPVESPR